MSSTIASANRLLFLDAPGLPASLSIESFEGAEGLSMLFSFRLELVTEDPKVGFPALLGKQVSFGVTPQQGEKGRFFHGLVVGLSHGTHTQRYARYSAEVVPQLWTLTKKFQTRIFQQKTVEEILKKVIGSIPVRFELRGSYAPRDYCVQYRETDFNFISRLMEEEGIFYYFEHLQGQHTLVITDTVAGLKEIPGTSRINFEAVSAARAYESRISNWWKRQKLGTGQVMLQDYNYGSASTSNSSRNVRPNVQVGRVSHNLALGGSGSWEAYDYPSRAKLALNKPGDTHKELEKGVVPMMERIEAAEIEVGGDSNVDRLTPGFKFTFVNHSHEDGAYYVTRVTHSASDASVETTGGAGEYYSNRFECKPMTLPFRPPIVAWKPQVVGCESARVVGPAGEEIYVDEMGRVKVQFFWDRDGKWKDTSSCWVRVATSWAGRNWGAIHIPRIGQEVLVSFLEGDPDHPVIVGSVYNGDMMPPYQLPDNKTQSGIKSRSSRGGGTSNFNEFRFEDKLGSEQVFLHAEKNQDIEVENDETHWVGHDRTTKIDHDNKTTIGHDDQVTIGNNETISIGNNRSVTISSNDDETVGGAQTITIARSQSVTVGQSTTITIASSKSETVGGSVTSSVAASITVTSGGGITITSGGPVAVSAGGPVTVNSAMISLNAAMVQVAGVLQCTTLIAATSVVSPSYTPGVGNMI